MDNPDRFKDRCCKGVSADPDSAGSREVSWVLQAAVSEPMLLLI